MEIPKPSEGGGNFELPPIGTHLAVCYQVIDLGTQEVTYDGQTKHAHQVRVSWELSDERMSDGRPFSVHKKYTWSMHEKATLRHHLEAWRGVAFAEKDFGKGGFDIKNILGKPCILTVVQSAGNNGKTYANVAGVGKLMKGQKDAAIYASLPDWMKEIIAKSPEYQELAGPTTAPDMADDELADDPIPF